MLVEKNSSYFTKRFISTQNIKCKENKWTKFGLEKFLETRWKKSVVVENVSLITDLKSCFTSLTQNRFQESWENRNKLSLQKIYICKVS